MKKLCSVASDIGSVRIVSSLGDMSFCIFNGVGDGMTEVFLCDKDLPDNSKFVADFISKEEMLIPYSDCDDYCDENYVATLDAGRYFAFSKDRSIYLKFIE